MALIDDILAGVSELPLLSDSALRLIALSGKAELAASDLSDIIQRDPSLTAHVLRVANSAAYKRFGTFTSVTAAVSALGNWMVCSIALGYCLSSHYNKQLPGYQSPKGSLWRNSLCTAIAAHQLAPYAQPPVQPETAYTVGLLHDVGKIVLSEFMASRQADVEAFCRSNESEDFLTCEASTLGITHDEVGCAVAKHWNLPEEICEAIAYQHDPENEEIDPQYRSLIYVLHVAGMISMMMGMEEGIDAMLYKMAAACERYIPLKQMEFESIIAHVQIEFQKMIDFSGDK